MRLGVLALLIASLCHGAPALAQSEPAYRNLDANGVDLTHGDSVLRFTEAVAGTGRSALELVRIRGGRRDFSSWDHLTFRRTRVFNTILITVENGVTSELFSGPNLTPRSGNGSTIAGSGASYTYTASDGTATAFGDPSGQGGGGVFCSSQMPPDSSCILLPISITSPDGRTVNLEWELHAVGGTYHYRVDEITSSYGYEVNFAYENNSPTPNVAPPDAWYERTGATLSNSARSETIGTVGYASASGATEVTDMAGRTWRIVGGPGNLTAIRRPGASADSIAIIYSGSTVSSATRDGVTTSYSRSVSGTTATMTVTDALSGQTVITSDMTVGRPTQAVDPLSRTTAFQYDSFGRLTRTTQPLGNYIQYTYDGRGNVTETRRVAQSGSGLPDIVTSASFDTSCSNPLTCNQPNSATDARGNVTDYTYDSTHGGVLTVTGPEPTSGAIRPQIRYSYTQSNGEYLLTGVSACASGTAPSCVGTGGESRTVIAYDANGHATSVEQRDGTGALSSTHTMTYTAAGDVETVNGPLPGAADTTRLRYNAARQRTGIIGPDPDGSGSLQHRATRIVYGSDGLPTAVQSGSVASQSDSDWANFSPAEEVQQSYDANARPVVQRLVSGSTAYALAQTGYDALGRVRCVAQRMNPSEYGSLPADACDLDTAGSFGPDRIVRTSYDAASQVILLETGIGTSADADEVATTFTSNGRQETVTDGENNRTTYVYDGHDRPSRTRMPSTTQGAGTSSTTDYEELTYETHASGTRTSGQVAARRLRDGLSIAYGYDALGRLTSRDFPNGYGEADVEYGYDLLGRMTIASQPAVSFTLTFSYDALGRLISQNGAVNSAMQYDAAGRRTRLTWEDGFYVDYDHLVTGEVSAIRENGATSGIGVLVTYAYDNLGRRASLTRGNGTVTSYGYDAVSRLSQLGQDFAGTSSDLILSFSHNPAAQIAQSTRSNDTYAYTARTNINVADTINGLNQVTATGSTSVSHDGRGNVSGIGSTGYAYTAENRLLFATTGGVLLYDPLGRLFDSYSPSLGYTFYAQDGETIIAEEGAGHVFLRRYVHGPGVDEPLVWYEGSGTSDRRWLHADERGSIVAISDSSGAVTSVNSYDEYGVPGSGNVGRFQYTGQAWLPELGMYYYRARFYNQSLGRFMQTDPIGYQAGMNLYGYVSGDPVNFTDPLGLGADPVATRPINQQTITVNGNRYQCEACKSAGLSSGERLGLENARMSAPERGERGEGGDRSQRPQTPGPRRPLPVCRTITVAAFSLLFGGAVIGEVGHALSAIPRLRGAIFGAQLGARAGLGGAVLGAAAGATLGTGLLVLVATSGERILVSICGPQ